MAGNECGPEDRYCDMSRKRQMKKFRDEELRFDSHRNRNVAEEKEALQE